MNREEYIFTGILDAILYFFIYILIPVVQIVVGFVTGSDFIHVIAIVSIIGLFYDCYTRYNEYTMEKTARKKMMWIGISAMCLLCCAVSAIIATVSGGEWPEFLNIAYAIIVLPFFICIHDGWFVTKISLKLL